MKDNKFAVKVHNEFLSKAIQELAFKNGYEFDSSDCIKTSLEYLYLCFGIFKERGLGYTNNTEWLYNTFDLVFDAKTDWDKIEQAMKPKEPRVIWVRDCIHAIPEDVKVFDYKPDVSKFGDCCSFTKFIEVIE